MDKSLLNQLREATKLEHQLIEQTYPLSALMSKDLNELIYFDVLKKFFAFYKSWEESVVNMLDKYSLDYQYISKIKLLKEDLLALGKSTEEINNIPLISNTPIVDTLESLIANLYVIEGSTLGGQMIRKKISSFFDKQDTIQPTFFDPYPKHCMKHWEMTSQFMVNTALHYKLDNKVICDNAVITFQLLREGITA